MQNGGKASLRPLPPVCSGYDLRVHAPRQSAGAARGWKMLAKRSPLLRAGQKEQGTVWKRDGKSQPVEEPLSLSGERRRAPGARTEAAFPQSIIGRQVSVLVLRIDGVTKSFGGLTAVDNVSLDVNRGEIIGIIGPNGAGKTTLLNCISGFYAPTKGKVYFNDKDITGMPPYELCRRGLARTFQMVRSFPKMTALENVKTAIIFGGGERTADPDRRAHEILDEVGFAMAHDALAETLNTMQLKRLMLARAIATRCELLLLDEVAAGLTTAELPDFIALVKQIRDRGVTIICIEHVMKFITDTSDRVIVINFGEKIAEGTAHEVLNNPFVIESYLGRED